MLICNPYEVVIHGTTSSGKIFRPGDWAERLCGILSSFTKDNRLSYSKWVRPMLVDNIRCVAVDKKLETDNPQMFRFLMDFAADNDLRVIDCKALLEEREQGGQNDPANERVLLAQAIEEKHAAEKTQEQTASGASYVLREIGADDTATAFAALSVLRSALTDIGRFTEQINKTQRPQGYRLLGIFEEGKHNAVAVWLPRSLHPRRRPPHPHRRHRYPAAKPPQRLRLAPFGRSPQNQRGNRGYQNPP